MQKHWQAAIMLSYMDDVDRLDNSIWVILAYASIGNFRRTKIFLLLWREDGNLYLFCVMTDSISAQPLRIQ